MLAAERGHSEIIEILLKSGADVNAKNRDITVFVFYIRYNNNNILCYCSSIVCSKYNNSMCTQLLYTLLTGVTESQRHHCDRC